LPAKHAIRLFGPARLVLSLAVAILVLLVVWVAVRAVGPAEASRQPTVVLPSMPQVPVAAPSSAPAPATALPVPPSSAAAVTSTPAVRASRASSPTPRPSRSSSSPKPVKTTVPPKNDLAVTVMVGAGWSEGYIAAVKVTNTSDAATSWKVTVAHDDLPDLRLAGVWNASGSLQGDSLTFSGGNLAAGRSATFGYQATKTGRGNARPSGCSVVGGTCGMR
jgi:cytoskeletal protein RodZ